MWTLTSVNPYNREINATYETLSDEELTRKIEGAHEAFTVWKKTSFAEKKVLFYKLAEVIEANLEETAKLQTLEMGMLHSESLPGLQGTANLIRWFADNAEKVLGEQEFSEDGFTGKFIYEPLGVLYWVAPWNFPYNQVLRAAVPNILAGNVQVYKHASNVPMCAEQIEKWFLEAWFPVGIYSNIFISSRQSELIISHEHVRGVNLTGGERAGKVLGRLAWENLKPSVLELGGNDAFIVANNSDLDPIVNMAIKGRMRNGGQACTASKRFIVLDEYYDDFCSKFAEKMWNLKFWDPFDANTQVQPICQDAARDEIHRQVELTIKNGAKLLTGGEAADINGKGFFYKPTVLADVTPDIYSFHEEIFGPVASVVRAQDVDHAIELANMIDLGLGGCVFGDDHDELVSIAERVETWMMFINKTAASKAALPFGWIKKSGYGKENGPEGLRAFTNKKVIVY
jgi:succinate-semialdehyde dehydrogenase/glutarate-semialdehyde dehydrogenase